jgi:hypothetical protein
MGEAQAEDQEVTFKAMRLGEFTKEREERQGVNARAILPWKSGASGKNKEKKLMRKMNRH